MTSRLRGIALAILALFVAASAHAQQADSAKAVRQGHLPGRGSVGGQVGSSFFVAGDDFSRGAQPRFSFAGSWRYVMSNHLRWQVSPYFTYAAYGNEEPAPFPDPQFPTDVTKDDVLAQVVGGNAQLQWTSGRGRTIWHAGVGPALYRVMVQNRRKVLADPVTLERHRTLVLGATGEFGVERFSKSLPNTSVEATLAVHAAFATDDQKFPSGWSGLVVPVELRVGGHYYYDFKRDKKPDVLPGSSKP